MIIFLAVAFYESNNVFSVFLLFVNLFYGYYFRVEKRIVIFQFFIGIMFFIYSRFLRPIKDFEIFTLFLNNVIGFDLRLKAINLLDEIHNQKTSAFLQLIIFNEKNSNNLNVYYDLASLAIVHLIVIGGFHVNFLCKIIDKIPYLGKPLCILVALILSYFNNFSAAMVRTFMVFFYKSFKKTKQYNYELTFLTIILLNPFAFLDLGLCMSFIAVRGLHISSKLKINNLFWDDLVTSFFATLYLVPYIGLIAKEISILGVLLTILFSPFFILVFFAGIFFAWFSVFDFVFVWFENALSFATKSYLELNLKINIGFYKNSYIFILHYLLIETFNKFFIKETHQWNLKKFTNF